MLFNSFEFIFLFLPVALIGFRFCTMHSRQLAIGWLTLMSVVFYGAWDMRAVVFLLGSMLINYLGARLIWRSRENEKLQTFWLIAAIAIDLGALCYFKYLFSMLNFLHQIKVLPNDFSHVVLPLGISFFTFTQIAYLIDLKGGEAELEPFPRFAFFVTFFPHLIAGPILHHREIMPQLQTSKMRLNSGDMAAGISLFVIGLFKKVMIADKIAVYVPPLFNNALHRSFADAWMGALCYTMQLYFDFSGYSDMALGLARMFSIRFPLNFNSPLKATSIIDFWQRWHMTLTRYLTLYLYTPISLAMTRREMRAGKRFSAKKKMTAATFLKLLAVPTIFTMFLAGIWHGSGFQFMLFGLLHGVYLTVNHMWRLFGDGVRKWAVPFSRRFSRLVSAGSVLLVVVSVIVAQVFFRAKSTHDALQIVSSMAGFNGFGHGSAIALSQVGLLALLWAIVWICPNSQEIVGYSPKSEIDHPITLVKKGWLLVRWQPSPGWAVAAAVIFVWALMATVNRTEFLYFQF